jgi:serine protease
VIKAIVNVAATGAALALAMTAFPASVAHAADVKNKARAARGPVIHQMIVKLRNPGADELVTPLGEDRVTRLSAAAGVTLRAHRPMSGDASVLRLESPLALSDAEAVARRLAADPSVEYAEPDRPVYALQTVPPDVGFTTRLWHYYAPTSVFVAAGKSVVATGGANLPGAWNVLRGSRKVVVALVDNGVVRTHPEIASALLPGYDFVSQNALGLPNFLVANDGDGRDADPNDPGDWITAAERANNAACDDPNAPAGQIDSSWHGTHMAGTIVGVWGNGVGGAPPAGTSTAGIAPNVRLLPVRALGKCGGSESDVADAITWAAGGTVPPVPANPNPAQIINLSLGGQGACSQTYATAIATAVANGALLVVASGNEAGAVDAPANCASPGVLAVAAHTIEGDKADYSNFGAQVGLSSPGGGTPRTLPTTVTDTDNAFYTWSSLMFGPTTQTSADSQGRSGPAIAGFTGTSSATAHVSAVAALVKSLQRNATPAQVRTFLVNNTRAHPAGGFCLANPGSCGSGLLDATAAVNAAAVNAPPLADAGADRSVTAGTSVQMDGTGSLAFNGRTITTYAWSQVAGTTVTLTGASTSQPTFTAPAAGQAVTLQLTVTDNTAQTDSINVTLTSAAPPPSGGGGGGGGALPIAQLLLLGLFALVAQTRRRS